MKKYKTTTRVTIEVTRIRQSMNALTAEWEAKAAAKKLVAKIKAPKTFEVIESRETSEDMT